MSRIAWPCFSAFHTHIDHLFQIIACLDIFLIFLQICTVEEGYIASPLDGRVQPLPPSQNALYTTLVAGASFEGALRLFALPTLNSSAAAPAFGWADVFLTPASPGSVNVLTEAWTFRGLYRHGPATSNDASGNPQEAVGDAFICPCPAATAAAAEAASGLPAWKITTQVGTLAEAEGVYVHDGVLCKWNFGYSALLDWNVLVLTPSVYAAEDVARLERLTAASTLPPPGGTLQGEGCYNAPCDLAADAASDTSVLMSLPAAVLYNANSSRSLAVRRPPGAGGRFAVSYQQMKGVPPTFQLRAFALQMNGTLKGTSSSILSVPPQRLGTVVEQQDGESIASDRDEAKDDLMGRKLRTASEGSSTEGPLLWALSDSPGAAAPCLFARGLSSTPIQYVNTRTFYTFIHVDFAFSLRPSTPSFRPLPLIICLNIFMLLETQKCVVSH